MSALAKAVSTLAPRPMVLGEVRSVWSAQALLGEGTLWSVREQALYWVDILGHRLHRFTPVQKVRDSWEFAEEITAVAERASAPGLLVTLRRDLAFFDTDTGRLQRLHQPEPAHPGNRFNDGKCDVRGRFWAGTMDMACRAATGAWYRYAGGTQCARVQTGFSVTNGPTWSLDQRTLYVNDTMQGRVMAYPFDPEAGTLGVGVIWLDMDPEDGLPHGMATDAAGRLWIAHWGGSCVTCHDPDTAQELLRIPVPASQITNCTFGGEDLRTLFISSACAGLSEPQLFGQPLASALFAVEVDSPGMPAHLFAG